MPWKTRAKPRNATSRKFYGKGDKLVSMGVIVTISTGRMFRSTVPYVEQLKLDVPVITYQGALIKNAISNEVVLARPLSLDISKDRNLLSL